MSFSRSLRSPMIGAGLQEELPPRIGAGVASGENTAIKRKLPAASSCCGRAEPPSANVASQEMVMLSLTACLANNASAAR